MDRKEPHTTKNMSNFRQNEALEVESNRSACVRNAKAATIKMNYDKHKDGLSVFEELPVKICVDVLRLNQKLR